MGQPDDQGSYLPTPSQIAETCAEIRAEWSDATRQRRNAEPSFGDGIRVCKGYRSVSKQKDEQ